MFTNITVLIKPITDLHNILSVRRLGKTSKNFNNSIIRICYKNMYAFTAQKKDWPYIWRPYLTCYWEPVCQFMNSFSVYTTMAVLALLLNKNFGYDYGSYMLNVFTWSCEEVIFFKVHAFEPEVFCVRLKFHKGCAFKQ